MFSKSQYSEISDTFTLYLRSSLRKTIRQWINHKEAVVYDGSSKPVDDKKFKVFLWVIILIGVYKSNNESVEQLWSTLDGRPIFNRTMSKGRHQQILRFLQFGNAQSRQQQLFPDKQQPIREVFETWDSYLRDSYKCRPSMTVHEQLVCFRVRCPFKQYIPSKPGKYGIKL